MNNALTKKEEMIFVSMMTYIGGLVDGMRASGNDLNPDELDKVLDVVKAQFRISLLMPSNLNIDEETQNGTENSNSNE